MIVLDRSCEKSNFSPTIFFMNWFFHFYLNWFRRSIHFHKSLITSIHGNVLSEKFIILHLIEWPRKLKCQIVGKPILQISFHRYFRTRGVHFCLDTSTLAVSDCVINTNTLSSPRVDAVMTIKIALHGCCCFVF